MKRKIAFLLVLLLLLSVSCKVQTREPTTTPAPSSGDETQVTLSDQEPVKLTLLALAQDEKIANVIRDQLKKAGMDLTVNIYVDNGTMTSAIETDKFDMALRGYSGVGSPDANVRGPLHSNGAWNITGHNDPEADRLIEEAARVTGEESLAIYKELEKYIVEEKTLLIPLASSLKTYAVNKNVVKEDSIEASVGGARWVWSTDYNDTSLRDTRPYIMGINWTNPNSFDCVQGRDGSTYYQRTNINVPLIQTAMGGVTTTRGSLTKSYTVAEGNQDLYFLLRTDINFGAYKGGETIDTGLPVSAEDVKYTYERAISDKVPNSVGKSYLASVAEINIVTDLEDLKSVQAAEGNISVFDKLNEGLDKPFTTLAADKYDADEDQGKYEVLHLHLSEQYPQQLITLSAGQISIVCKERIEEMNAGIDVDNYDPTKHVLYGDPSTLKKDEDSGMYFSGQYVLKYVDDYGSYLEINPGFAPGAEDAPKIKHVEMLAIPDNSTQTASFRNGELDEAMPGGENVALVESDSNLSLVKTPSVAVYSIYPLFRGESKMVDENLRKAVLYAINTEELIAVLGADNYVHAGSNLIMLNTGYLFKQDLQKSAEYLQKYRDSN
jgi:peptide/nickel transport system substrate-binding protein